MGARGRAGPEVLQARIRRRIWRGCAGCLRLVCAVHMIVLPSLSVPMSSGVGLADRVEILFLCSPKLPPILVIPSLKPTPNLATKMITPSSAMTLVHLSMPAQTLSCQSRRRQR